MEGEKEVLGLAVALSSSEIARLDPFEGYPKVYDRKNVTMVSLTTTKGPSGTTKEETLQG